MLCWAVVVLVLGTNWSEGFKACVVELSRLNFAEDMESFLMWQKHDVSGHLICVLQCYLDPRCASVQVSSINSSTCMAFKDGLLLTSAVDSRQLHYLVCRPRPQPPSPQPILGDLALKLKQKCEAVEEFYFRINKGHPICFKLYKWKKPKWNSANKWCHKVDAELVELNSVDKLDAIQQVLKNLPHYAFWLGLRKDYTRKGNTVFKWRGTNLTYTGKWVPESDPDDGDCAVLLPEGVRVTSCEKHRRFICEIK